MSSSLIRKSHQLERRKATELLLFVATDTDRMFCKDKPTSIPVAFALKGRSICTITAQKLINQVRDKMKEQQIPILCECMDGQWAGIVFRDEETRPLTVYELQQDATLAECPRIGASKKNSVLSMFSNNIKWNQYPLNI